MLEAAFSAATSLVPVGQSKQLILAEVSLLSPIILPAEVSALNLHGFREHVFLASDSILEILMCLCMLKLPGGAGGRCLSIESSTLISEEFQKRRKPGYPCIANANISYYPGTAEYTLTCKRTGLTLLK